jgi:hypothetical protein
VGYYLTDNCPVFEVSFSRFSIEETSILTRIFVFNYDLTLGEALEIAEDELDSLIGGDGVVVNGIKELDMGFIVMYKDSNVPTSTP